jgi:rhamnulose-1-phosphate aldolase
MPHEIDPSPLAPFLEQLREVSRLLWEKGWAERNAGNLSIDVTDEAGPVQPNPDSSEIVPGASSSCTHMAGRFLLATGTGCKFRDIAAAPLAGVCLMNVAGNGNSCFRLGMTGGCGSLMPTSELPSHLMIHDYLRRTCAPERVVLHTHPTELIALTQLSYYQDQASLNRALWGMMPEVKVVVPAGAGLVPYLLPGSGKLASATVAKLEEGHKAVLWSRHGCLAVGATAIDAFDIIDTLNKAAQVLLHCLSAGERPAGLSDGDLRELAIRFNLKV